MHLIMSDFHLGNPLFNIDNKIIKLFNDKKIKRIYLLGDIFDTWEENIEKTINKHNNLIQVINNSHKVDIIIRGNHDPDIDIMRDIFYNKAVLDHYEDIIHKKKVYMAHGDEFDNTELFGKLLFKPIKLLERLTHLNIRAIGRSMLYNDILRSNNANYNSVVLEMEIKLVNKYSSNYDIMIFGHTHIPKIVKINNSMYINCGSIIDNKTYLIIDKNTVEIGEL